MDGRNTVAFVVCGIVWVTFLGSSLLGVSRECMKARQGKTGSPFELVSYLLLLVLTVFVGFLWLLLSGLAS